MGYEREITQQIPQLLNLSLQHIMGAEHQSVARQREARYGKVKDSNIILRWLRLHCFINLFKSIRRPLQEKDFYNSTPDLHPETNYNAFVEARQKHPTDSLMKVLMVRLFWGQLLIAIIAGLISAGLGYAGPVFINKILEFIATEDPTSAQQNRAYMYAGIWTACYFVGLLFDQQAQWNCIAVSMKAEQAIQMAIYTKMMKLAPKQRTVFQEGDFMTLFTIDTRLACGFFQTLYILFSGPAIIITAQVFLFIEVGAYGLIMTAVILASLVFQFFLCKWTAQYQVEKLSQYQKRTIANIELLEGLKQLKCLGWEELFRARNKEMRAVENPLNRKIYLLNSLYTFVVGFVPTFIVFLVVVTNRNLSTKQIYTMITYIGLIYGSINSLPPAIFSIWLAKEALTRLTELFNMKQRQEAEQSPTIIKGVIVKNYVGLCYTNDGKGNRLRIWPKINSLNRIKPNPIYGGTQPTDSPTVSRSEVRLNTIEQQRRNIQEQSQQRARQLRVPFRLAVLPSQRLFVIGQSFFDKAEFIQTLIGNGTKQYGTLSVQTKLSYAPEKPFVSHYCSIKSNILFGEPFDESRFNMVSGIVELSSQLSLLSKSVDETIDNLSLTMSHVLQHKISLARALYFNSDVIVTEEIFESLPIDLVERILTKIEGLMPNVSLVISTTLLSIIRPKDKVIIFQKGNAIQYSLYEYMTVMPSSALHQIKTSPSHRISQSLTLRKKPSLVVRPMKQLSFQGNHNDDQIIPHTTILTRSKGVPIKFYWALVRKGIPILFLLLIIIVAVSQGVAVFSVWWIGSAEASFPNLSSRAIIGIYVALVLGYATLFLFSCLIVMCLSLAATQQLAIDAFKTLENVDSRYLDTQSKVMLVAYLAIDNEDVFTLHNTILSVFVNIFFYMGIAILNGISNKFFFILAGVVLIINYLIILIYIRAERQTFWWCMDNCNEYFKHIEDTINSIDLVICYDKIEASRKRFFDLLYVYNTLYKINNLWLLQGMSLLSSFTALGVTFGSAAFSIKTKSMHPSKTSFAGPNMALANQLSKMSSGLVYGLASVEIQIRMVVNLPLWYLDIHKQGTDIEKPQPPPDWPSSSEIELNRVTFKDPADKVPLIENLNAKFPSASRIMVKGKHNVDRVVSFMCLLNKLQTPTPNKDQPIGQVIVGRLSTTQIGRKYLRQHVILIDNIPLILTGNLRTNLDPYDKYSDVALSKVLKLVGLLDSYEFFGKKVLKMNLEDKLNHQLVDSSLGILMVHSQLINIARVLLMKPLVLMCIQALSASLEEDRRRLYDVLMRFLPSTTILLFDSDSEELIPGITHVLELPEPPNV